MKKKIFAGIMTAALAISLLAGCGTYTTSSETASSPAAAESTAAAPEASGTDEAAEPAAETADKETSVTILYNPCVTLNVFQSQSTSDFSDYYLIMSSLFRYYGDEIENDLCTDYTVSDDGLTYTFNLREAKYEDGSDIVAGDFVYYLEYSLNPENGCASQQYFNWISNADKYLAGECEWSDVGVKLIDDHSFSISIDQPDGSVIRRLTGDPIFPIKKEFVEKWGQELGSSPESILCSGAYSVVDLQPDVSLTLKKRDDWWNAENEFPVDNVFIQKVSTASTAASMFENGQADIYPEVDANYIPQLQDYVTTFASGGQYYVWIREQGMSSDEVTKVLDNDNFRLALVYALDRSLIGPALDPNYIGTNRVVYGNYATATGKYVEEYPLESIVPVEGDREKAVEYLNLALEELGYSDVSELPEMLYLTYEDDKMKLLGETIVDTWKQVLGITSIQFQQQTIGTAIGSLYGGQYDIFQISGSSTLLGTEEMSYFQPNGEFSFHSTNWDENVFAKFGEIKNYEFGTAEYYKAVSEAEEAFLNENSLVPLYDITNSTAVSPRVKNYMVSQNTGYMLNYVEIDD